MSVQTQINRLKGNVSKALLKIAAHTEDKDALIFVGLPLAVDGELYNVAAALKLA